ncbi:replisome organizer [Candidatus Enterococcus clewellii]|uniref:Phage replication initiation protein n=1 Tax=Candidatus Enterococcus clewellii TaxID=1834193 RepID=A0A242K461_9ENTE|nr:replisome organizer [Enterococcus sp. 9E7_DIV0242]OTP13691.1 hypothetical protein A5888_003169 [Enterococcus sp. 9E7_DIV0242]
MAQRRMFSKKITDTDLFLDMPLSAQCLYFHLNMEADDDGFLGNAKTIRRKIGASEDDLKLLTAKQFIIPFESGVVVIKDWKIHNYIQKDRYNKTMFFEEKERLSVDKNNRYQIMDTECIQDVSEKNEQNSQGRSEVTPEASEPLVNKECVHDGYSLDTQVRLELGKSKDRLDKEIGETASKKQKPKPTRHKYGEYKNVLLSDQDMEKLKEEFPNDWEQRIEKVSGYCASTGKSYKNYLATIRQWAKRDNQLPQRVFSNRQPIRQEKIPDSIANPVPEEKLSAEQQAKIDKQMEDFLNRRGRD